MSEGHAGQIQGLTGPTATRGSVHGYGVADTGRAGRLRLAAGIVCSPAETAAPTVGQSLRSSRKLRKVDGILLFQRLSNVLIRMGVDHAQKTLRYVTSLTTVLPIMG